MFTLAAAVSLVLCLAVLALWVRSHWSCDQLRLKVGDRSLGFYIPAGRLVFFCNEYEEWWGTEFVRRPPIPAWDQYVSGILVARPLGGGFGYISRPDNRMIWLPTWFAAAATAVMPATWLARRVIAATRHPRGHCPTCGYDLRATPDRCPECGTVPAAKATAQIR